MRFDLFASWAAAMRTAVAVWAGHGIGSLKIAITECVGEWSMNRFGNPHILAAHRGVEAAELTKAPGPPTAPPRTQ